MHYNSILIITYGRSGSTLLQGILNSIEGCVIKGENNNFCYHLFKAYKALKNTQIYKGKEEDNPRHPWFGYNSLDVNFYLDQTSDLIKKLLLAEQTTDPKISCYGFKEIRYMQKYHIKDFFEYLEFLKKVFPKVAFIFNTRNHDDVLASGWWEKMDSDQVRKEIIDLEANFRGYCQDYDNAFLIDYKDVVLKSDKFMSMFEFLGVKYDAQKIDSILRVKHGYETER